MAEKLSAFQQVNIDKALEAFNGDRYQLILAASLRAREIQTRRNIEARDGKHKYYENQPPVAALKEFANGQFGLDHQSKIRS